MKKRKIFLLILSCLALFLEALPYGAVLIFATPEGEGIRKLYSYFDLVTFGYANFAPMLVAISTVIIVILSVASLFFRLGALLRALRGFSVAAALVSFAPVLLFGVRYFSVVGALISVVLICVALVCFFQKEAE